MTAFYSKKYQSIYSFNGIKDNKNNVLSIDKKTIRIYLYYFKGYDKPLPIEAQNRNQADDYVIEETNKLYGHIDTLILEDVKVMTPVYGITEKEENKIVYVWVGFEKSNTGWLSKNDFNNLKDKMN